ncbi:MAG: ABC transporter permease subunit, partial [Chloroflexi bacterium]|nr:ABC transporter permease subunit [Chloroflexota bacterium]
LAGLRDWMASSPVKSWFSQRKVASPRSAELIAGRVESPQELSADLEDGRVGSRRAWIQSTLGNFPFMVGGILIAGLLVIIVFSNRLAPHSPYTTHGLTIVNGEFSVPPFKPGEIYPWGTDVIGRDIMSLIIAGAQQTLFLTGLVVLARMVVGFSLGAVAGWLNGSWIDRLLLRMSEIIAAFPTLLLAMILILALGIRQGMRPFIIALCFVGWGDIMQFIRGEVMSIRPQLFIESAVALGARTPRIILKHVLPNLIPTLISLVALEMGAVLMLLGELGFIGIFIGGGAFAELAMYVPPYHYSDVPEWSALLSSIRPYARSYPWTATYPALAFFVAILGFNLFGEGIRRMVERIGVEVTRLITNRYTVAVAAIAIVGFVWTRGSTGATAFYQRQADAFDGQQAMIHVEVLSDPALYGRAVGTSGVDAAAEYIAEQFETMDIQPAGEQLTYFQTRSRSFESLDALPLLSIEDDDSSLVYHQDYVEYSGENRNLGEASGPVRFVALGELTRIGDWDQKIPALEELDYSDEILLTLAENDLRNLEYLPRKGILIVARDPVDLRRHYTLSFLDPHDVFFGTQQQRGQDTPTLWISEAVADRLLEGTGYTVRQLRSIDEGLDQDEIFEVPTGTPVSMEVQGSARENVPVRHVIGHLPGTYGQPGEFELDNKMIVVLAQYDSPPLVPDGDSYPAANDNASGVAVMLEVIRIMQETGYQPYKTFLFVTYSGEGLEGGAVFHPEVSKFLQTKYGFSTIFEVEAIVDLRGLGAESGNDLLLSTGGSLRLANLFESAARRMGVPVRRASEQVDMSIVFDDRSLWEGSQEAPSIGISWDGWEATARTSSDIIEAISVDNLEEAGRALSLALMILGRETQY